MVLIYATLFAVVLSAFYLSLTVSHIYLYFVILASATYFIRNYVYLVYALYLNFY